MEAEQEDTPVPGSFRSLDAYGGCALLYCSCAHSSLPTCSVKRHVYILDFTGSDAHAGEPLHLAVRAPV